MTKKGFRRTCLMLTFMEIDEAIELAKQAHKFRGIDVAEQLKRYKILKKQEEEIIYLCKGPDNNDPREIITCKGCKDYTHIDKYG